MVFVLRRYSNADSLYAVFSHVLTKLEVCLCRCANVLGRCKGNIAAANTELAIDGYAPFEGGAQGILDLQHVELNSLYCLFVVFSLLSPFSVHNQC